MEKTSYQISYAALSERELKDIQKLSEELKLDTIDIGKDPFLLVKEADCLIGFGRLKVHKEGMELSTIGVVPGLRNRGIGKLIAKELIKRVHDTNIYLVTVIPEYFSQFGFHAVESIPGFLSEKIDQCADKCHKEYPTTMRLVKPKV